LESGNQTNKKKSREEKMRKKFLMMFVSVVGVVFLLSPVLAKGERMTTLMGSIQGRSCVIQMKVCPAGQEDPLAAAEIGDVLVLLVNPAEADFYVMPNVDMKVLSRLINEQVKVVGYVDKERKSIWTEEIYDGTKMVWNSKMQDELREKMYSYQEK
jgi:hypothetical protein